MSWEGFSGVRVLALPGDVSYAADHGVYLADGQVGARRFAFEKKNVNSVALLVVASDCAEDGVVCCLTGSGEGHPLQGSS